MSTSNLKVPYQINLIIALLISTVIVDQLSAFYDAHWQIAELSFEDPIYLGLFIFWFAIIAWLIVDIIKRKKHIPGTLRVITIIVSLFCLFELLEVEFTVSLVASFQFLELILWLIAYRIGISRAGKEWFIN